MFVKDLIETLTTETEGNPRKLFVGIMSCAQTRLNYIEVGEFKVDEPYMCPLNHKTWEYGRCEECGVKGCKYTTKKMMCVLMHEKGEKPFNKRKLLMFLLRQEPMLDVWIYGLEGLKPLEYVEQGDNGDLSIKFY